MHNIIGVSLFLFFHTREKKSFPIVIHATILQETSFLSNNKKYKSKRGSKLKDFMKKPLQLMIIRKVMQL